MADARPLLHCLPRGAMLPRSARGGGEALRHPGFPRGTTSVVCLLLSWFPLSASCTSSASFCVVESLSLCLSRLLFSVELSARPRLPRRVLALKLINLLRAVFFYVKGASPHRNVSLLFFFRNLSGPSAVDGAEKWNANSRKTLRGRAGKHSFFSSSLVWLL